MLGILLLILLIILITKNNKNKKSIIRCDGCEDIIEGKYIRITEQALKRPLDYCSQECKEKHLKRDRVRYADMEVE